VLPDCVEAVRGVIIVDDTVRWRGVHGMLAVRSDALITGEAMRDVMMHAALQTYRFPEILFTLDSLVGLTKDSATDTLQGTAVGTLTIRGLSNPTVATVRVFPDAGGMRVLAKWHVSAAALLDLTPLIHTLGLGVNVWIWHRFFMGADLVFHREATPP
jgi:polyisoprenoid-binding protein YceI